MTADDNDPKSAGDRRGSGRRRVLKTGIIAFNGHHSTLPCAVRDVSETGARLQVSGAMNAPDTFDLIIELDGLTAHCVVVSRKVGEVRVRFTEPPKRGKAKRVQVVAALAPEDKPSLRRKPV